MTFKDKKIVIMGLGTHGGGVEDALFFIKEGADVVITDLRNKKDLESSVEKINNYCKSINEPGEDKIRWVLGEHREKDFKNADMVIKNPAVPNKSPYLEIARSNKVPVKTSTTVFMELADTSRIIGVTGTKGKSSTVNLVYEIMKAAGFSVDAAGNIGKSPLSLLPMKNEDWVVLELSSWQLEGATQNPHVAAITNIDKDHLDRYESYNEYVEAKKRIFKHQNKNDYLVLNKNSLPVLFNNGNNWQKSLKQQVVVFSAKDIEHRKVLPAQHHPENILCALKITELLNMSETKALEAISNSKTLFGRLEYIGDIKDVEIYNDTTATNPYATLRSIEKFKDKKVALILGGEDKDLDYSDLAKELKNIHHVSLLPGTASDKIYSHSTEHGTWNSKFKKTETLEATIEECLNSKPDIILFSPAASSFNMFRDEFDRGERFVKIIKNYNA